ncbi:hypothetical protein GCM10009107_28220 [Ideonella azotifigens]|uniref:Uncharacterized protein n=1 Tax=Ideonella azotifigens TaxID=513160 RepID=A0ABN1K2U2_9BURK
MRRDSAEALIAKRSAAKLKLPVSAAANKASMAINGGVRMATEVCAAQVSVG